MSWVSGAPLPSSKQGQQTLRGHCCRRQQCSFQTMAYSSKLRLGYRERLGHTHRLDACTVIKRTAAIGSHDDQFVAAVHREVDVREQDGLPIVRLHHGVNGQQRLPAVATAAARGLQAAAAAAAVVPRPQRLPCHCTEEGGLDEPMIHVQKDERHSYMLKWMMPGWSRGEGEGGRGAHARNAQVRFREPLRGSPTPEAPAVHGGS